jgi:hypothetical protein
VASAPTLINSVEVSEITASKITAGTIGAHEIILTQPGTQTSYTPPSSTAVLRSSNYSAGTAGWLIRGDGLAEFNDLTVRSRLDIGGDDASSFHVDNNGNMWLGAGILNYSTAPFRVSNTGALVATNANVTGTINASGGTITGYLTSGGVDIGVLRPSSNYYKGINLSPDNATQFQSCFIRGNGGEVYLRADNGTQWIKFENGTVQIKAAGFEVNGSSASFSGNVSAASGDIAGINLSAGRLFSGPNGNWANANTGFYLDLNGYFSLKNQLYFNPDANGGVGVATFTGALSGASGSVGANFNIGDNLYVGNFVRINGPDASNVTVTKIRGIKNLGSTGSDGTWTLVLEGPNGTNKWEVRDDGLMQYRTQSAYSDVRIKTNIETSNLGLHFINSLKPRSYNLSLGENEDGIEIFKQVKTYGFVAQEVKETYEQYTDSFDGWGLSIAGDDNSLQTVSYDNFISPLVKAIQELSAKVDELESRLV